MLDKFKELSDKNPNLSSAMVFVKLVKGKRMSVEQIEPLFDSLVDKSDWKGTPRKELLSWLSKFSHCKT
jgi:hypothetical protein